MKDMKDLVVYFSGNGNSRSAFPFDPGTDTSSVWGQTLQKNTTHKAWSELDSAERKEIAAGWAADFWNFGANNEQKKLADLFAVKPYPEETSKMQAWMIACEEAATEYLTAIQ